MKKFFTEPSLERMKPPPQSRMEYGDTVVPGLTAWRQNQP
jgi:hypothetical protein